MCNYSVYIPVAANEPTWLVSSLVIRLGWASSAVAVLTHGSHTCMACTDVLLCALKYAL